MRKTLYIFMLLSCFGLRAQGVLDDAAIRERIKNTLPPEEVAALEKADRDEKSVVNFARIYSNNYKHIVQLADQYRQVAKEADAEKIVQQKAELERVNRAVADTISTLWSNIFDQKTFCYNYIIDLLNQRDLILELEQKSREAFQQTNEDQGAYASDALSRYANEKPLVLYYESRIAGLFDSPSAAATISKAAKAFDPAEYKLPRVEFAERNFIDYADITVGPNKYTAANPIPKSEIYAKGNIYRILLGSYAKAVSPLTFKGIYPLSYIVDKGRYNYYAGGYASLEECVAGLEAVKKAGIRDAKVGAWEEGEYRVIPGGTLLEAAASAKYRVEISGADNLSAEVREAIGEKAAGKDVTKASGAAGSTVFIVGSFDNLLQAETFAKAVTDNDKTVAAKVVMVPIE